MRTSLCRMRTESLATAPLRRRETVFGRQRQKAPNCLRAVLPPSRDWKPTSSPQQNRGYSANARKSRLAQDCVVGLGGFEPPTRPLYPDVSGAYASHRLPIIARYFLERRTIGIGLRHVRRLRLLSGVDFSRR